MRHIAAFVREEEGATAIEYALVASLIALAIVGAFTLVATNTISMWQSVATHVAPQP